MKKVFLILLVFTLLCLFNVQAQVMIGLDEKPQDFSVLELESNGEKGLRMPQLSASDLTTLTDLTDFITYKLSDAKGLLVYNLNTNALEFWNGTQWVEF